MAHQTTSIGNNVVNESEQLLANNLIKDSSLNFYGTERTQPGKAWVVPRQVNRLFTGRTEVLAQIDGAFSTDNGAKPSQKRLVIAGLGGTGKSELCLKYASDNRQKYDYVLWIDCTSEETALRTFQQIGQTCKFANPSTLDSVLCQLANVEVNAGKKPFLMIIDNADDVRQNYLVYCPTCDSGDILITSRDKDLIEEYGTVDGIHLDQLEPDDACDLFLRAAKMTTSQLPEADREVVLDIVQKLGRHTLALVHAGSFIGEGHCTTSQYLEMFRKKEHDLHDILHYENRRSPSAYKTVHTTFEVSVNLLKEMETSGDRVAKDALELLSILGFFNNGCNIGLILGAANLEAQKILSEASTSALPFQDSESVERGITRLTVHHAREVPEFAPLIGSDDGGSHTSGSVRLSQASRLLSAVSLITLTKSESNMKFFRIDMHPLVHSWALRRLFMFSGPDFANGRACWLKAASILALERTTQRKFRSIQFLADTATLVCLQAYLDFVEEDSDLDVATILPVLFVLIDNIFDYRILAKLGPMIKALRREVKRQENKQAVAQDQIWQAFARIDKTEAYHMMSIGKWHDAIDLFRRNYSQNYQSYSTDPVTMVICAMDLSRAFIGSGNPEEAITLLRDGIEMLSENIQEARGYTVLKKCKFLLARIELLHLAEAYRNNGQKEESLNTYRQAVKVCEETLDSTDLQLLFCELATANELHDQGFDREALPLLERVARVMPEVLTLENDLTVHVSKSLDQVRRNLENLPSVDTE